MKKLYKSKHNKVIAGVMGGLGEYLELDPVLMRVLFLGLSAFTGIVPGVLAYFFMALVMPVEPEALHQVAHHA